MEEVHIHIAIDSVIREKNHFDHGIWDLCSGYALEIFNDVQ